MLAGRLFPMVVLVKWLHEKVYPGCLLAGPLSYIRVFPMVVWV
jgi:hypothetical protein